MFAAEVMALGDVAECAASDIAWAEDTSDSSTNEFCLGVVSTLRKQRCLHSAQACPMESPQTNLVSAVLIATLSAETCLSKGRIEQPLDRSQSRGAQDRILLITNSSPTELSSKAVAQDDTDELDRLRENQDERRRAKKADERRTSNAESEVEGEFVRGDGHGKNRLEASTNEEDGWTLAEEHEDIQDDVAIAAGAWNENAAAFEQNYQLDTVLALDANDAASDNEVVKEAENAIVEGEAVDLLEVYDDRKDEATLCDVMTEEVLVPAKGAPLTGWRVDCFPQGPGRMRLVSTPLWSLRPPTCEPELWLIIGKAAQRDEGERYADDRDAFAAQEERCSSWRRAKRGGVVACGVQGPLVDEGGELPGAGSAGDGHACLPCAFAVRAINDDPVVTSEGGFLAHRARRCCDTCVETLVQQARTPIMSGIHGRAFLELCYASDSEVAAVVVEHSVVIRVTSFEDVQLTSRRPALYCLLMICKAYEVVANIWVFDPMHCWHAYVGLCRHAVRIVEDSVGSGSIAMSSGTWWL